MIILAVDPGTEQSAWVLFETNGDRLIRFGLDPNETVLANIKGPWPGEANHMVVERFKSYGNIMGDSVLDTCIWIGRYVQAWTPKEYALIPRKTVVTYLTGNARGNDANVRAYLIDRWGGKRAAIGNAYGYGPLHGVRSDIWSALAIACAWSDLCKDLETKLK